jgi:ceramide glucosyltransferase
VIQCVLGWLAVARFAASPAASPTEYPAVTILRPLYGAEPMLEAALASCFSLAYPNFQIVFGLHHQSDPALAVVERLRHRFPQIDIAIVVDPALHGPNRKVSNLINMLPSAAHEILVISDSDLHLPPDYLDRLVLALETPDTGLVTSAYFGLPAEAVGWQGRLGATQITHNFLPSVLMSRVLGRQDCLGSTTMIRKATLEQTGGLRALADLLAEDNVLGRRVRDLGLSIGLSDTIVAATVPEATVAALWHHEIRWARTIRVTAPLALAASTVQYPLFWAAMAVAVSGGALWSAGLFGMAWAMRISAMVGIDRALRPRTGFSLPPSTALLLPLRDLLSVVEVVACYCVDHVLWRGHKIGAVGDAVPSVQPQWAQPEAPAVGS